MAEVRGSGALIRRAMMTAGRLVGAYTRLEHDEPADILPPPALIVANHGFGGMVDLNVFALAETFRRMGFSGTEQAVILTHQMLWSLGVGRYFEPAGFFPAGRDAAMAGFDAGRYVFVLPGGDMDASKTWSHRNHVHFAGRSGFARLAIEAGVPILPVVIVGAGESLLVLSDGQRLARLLRLDKILRVKTLPVTVSIPWGLTVGLTGIVPYLPLPTKLKVGFCQPINPSPGDDPVEVAAAVHQAMSAKAAGLAEGRIPVVG